MSITILDGILLGVMLISAFLAMMRGFVREVFSIGTWIAAAAAALFFHPFLSAMIFCLWRCQRQLCFSSH